MDVRTFLQLEVALTRKLVKSWREMSAPVYAKIEEAVKEGRFDAARQLVNDLDMTEVGSENREYIRYALLGFATFGGMMTNNDTLKFLSQGNHNAVLNNVVRQVMQYLENGATKQVRQQALQLIANAEGPTQKGDFKYGCVMIDIHPDSEMGQEIDRLRSLIPDEHLMGDGKDIGENHVTVRYGIKGDVTGITEYLRSQDPITMVLGKATVFKPTVHSDWACPVVIDVLSHDLKRMHSEIAEHGDFKASDFSYHAHTTLAYVKPELAYEYELLPVKGRQYYAISAVISDTDGNRTEVPFVGEKKADMVSGDLSVAGRKNPQMAAVLKKKKKTQKDDEQPQDNRYVKPFVSFADQGNDQLQLIASLNGSRLATWGFCAEAEVRNVRRYVVSEVLDGRCCPFCREVANGKEFSVEDASRLVNEALSADNPEDLKTIQPWPGQSAADIAMYKEMDEAQLVGEGLQIPPYHAGCRGVLMAAGGETEQVGPTTVTGKQAIPQETAQAGDFSALGMNVSSQQLDHWNAMMGVNPIQYMANLLGIDPQAILDGDWKSVLKFMKNGDVGVTASGAADDITAQIGTTYDPFSGKFYLDDASFVAGDTGAESAFLTKLYGGLISTGQSVGASSLAVQVAEGAVTYLKMGFLPSSYDWQNIRLDIKEQLDGSLSGFWNSLDDDQKQTLMTLLNSNDEASANVIANLGWVYDGQTVGDLLLGDVKGKFSLDLTDENAVQAAKEYLSESGTEAESE